MYISRLVPEDFSAETVSDLIFGAHQMREARWNNSLSHKKRLIHWSQPFCFFALCFKTVGEKWIRNKAINRKAEFLATGKAIFWSSPGWITVNYYTQMGISDMLNGCHTHNFQPVHHWDAQDLSCMHVITLEHMKTLVNVSQCVQSRKKICQSCTSQKMSRCFGCLSALQQWSAK